MSAGARAQGYLKNRHVQRLRQVHGDESVSRTAAFPITVFWESEQAMKRAVEGSLGTVSTNQKGDIGIVSSPFGCDFVLSLEERRKTSACKTSARLCHFQRRLLASVIVQIPCCKGRLCSK